MRVQAEIAEDTTGNLFYELFPDAVEHDAKKTARGVLGQQNPSARAGGENDSLASHSSIINGDDLNIKTVSPDDAQSNTPPTVLRMREARRTTHNWIDRPSTVLPEGVHEAPGRAVNALADVLPQKMGDYLHYLFGGTTAPSITRPSARSSTRRNATPNTGRRARRAGCGAQRTERTRNRPPLPGSSLRLRGHPG